jgi:SAM-dependent methyltransferase
VRGYTERLRYRNKDKIWDGMYEAAEADPASLVWNAGGADEDIASFFRARFGDPGGGGRRARVLEIGCGLGHDSLRLAHLGHDVTCAEISPASVRMLPELREALTVVIWNIERDPLEALGGGGAWDAVLMRSVLLHVSADFKGFVLARIRELLRPGTGVFVDKEYDMERSAEWASDFNRGADSDRRMRVGPDFMVPRGELEALFEAAGFASVSVSESWFKMHDGQQGPAALLFVAENGQREPGDG